MCILYIFPSWFDKEVLEFLHYSFNVFVTECLDGAIVEDDVGKECI